MKNRIELLIIFLIIILNLSACNNHLNDETVIITESETTISLTPNNTEEDFDHDILCGIIDIVDDWIYYHTNMWQGCNLKKIRTDGTERTKLNEDSSDQLRLFEDWVYYTNNEDGNAYKIKLDGKERKMLEGDLAYYYNTVDGWIYFSNLQSDYRISKRQVDCTEVFKLSDESGAILKISDGFVFYNNWNDGGRLYRISKTGDEEMRLTDESVGRINIIKEWLYYSTDDTDGCYIYRIRLDGSEKQDLDIEIFRKLTISLQN